jgi:hypothetical protein
MVRRAEKDLLNGLRLRLALLAVFALGLLLLRTCWLSSAALSVESAARARRQTKGEHSQRRAAAAALAGRAPAAGRRRARSARAASGPFPRRAAAAAPPRAACAARADGRTDGPALVRTAERALRTHAPPSARSPSGPCARIRLPVPAGRQNARALAPPHVPAWPWGVRPRARTAGRWPRLGRWSAQASVGCDSRRRRRHPRRPRATAPPATWRSGSPGPLPRPSAAAGAWRQCRWATSAAAAAAVVAGPMEPARGGLGGSAVRALGRTSTCAGRAGGAAAGCGGCGAGSARTMRAYVSSARMSSSSSIAAGARASASRRQRARSKSRARPKAGGARAPVVSGRPFWVLGDCTGNLQSPRFNSNKLTFSCN